MSLRKLPDYRLKQKILYIDNTEPNVLQSYGDAFFAEGNLSDSLDFYQKANYIEGLQKIKDSAMNNGDVMLFQGAAKALKIELKPAEWENVGKKAIELKKYSFAHHALNKANNEEMLKSLTKIMETEVD